ncbi:MAG: hypothetical protein IH859_05305, partial [Chloroflexi bacterium]|nr:hypothetical protein [Chloroflexota bacterium]
MLDLTTFTEDDYSFIVDKISDIFEGEHSIYALSYVGIALNILEKIYHIQHSNLEVSPESANAIHSGLLTGAIIDDDVARA